MMKTILEQMKEFAELGYYGEDYLSNTVDAAKDELEPEGRRCIWQLPDLRFR